MSLPKRKPRRQHNTTEVSLGRISRDCLGYLSRASQEIHNDDDILIPNDQPSSLTDRYASDSINRVVTKSCPELHDQSDEFDESAPLKLKVGGTRLCRVRLTMAHIKQKDDNRQPAPQGRHHPRFNVQDFRALRSLGYRTHCSGSPAFSTRTEFPAPPDRKRRRLLSRDSVDICPSSGDETPIYNTPDPDHPRCPTGSYIDPLAMASVVIAVGKLNRLSSQGRRRGSQSETPSSRTSASMPALRPGRNSRRASRLPEVMSSLE